MFLVTYEEVHSSYDYEDPAVYTNFIGVFPTKERAEKAVRDYAYAQDLEISYEDHVDGYDFYEAYDNDVSWTFTIRDFVVGETYDLSL